MIACLHAPARPKLIEMEKIRAEIARLAADPDDVPETLLDDAIEEIKKTKIQVGQEKIDGAKATVEIIQDGDKEPVPLVKEQDGWKLVIPVDEDDIKELKDDLEALRKKSGTKTKVKVDCSTPKATANSLLAAAKAGDKDAIGACFSAETRKKLAEMARAMAEAAKAEPGTKSTDMLDAMIEHIGKTKTEFGEEKITGDKATLGVTSDGKKDTIQLIKEGGAWRIVIPISDAEIQRAKEMHKKEGAKEQAPKPATPKDG